MAKLENLIVLLKLLVLIGLGLGGLMVMDPAMIAPETYPPVRNIFFCISITFFAYTGFSVITNTAEDMPNPTRTLPRAMLTAISLVIVVYVGVSLAVFGNLPAQEVIAAKDYALAEAAKPIFGDWGFQFVAIAALISTASAINASLYSATNISYQLAKDGELPAEFGKPIGHSREGMLISVGVAAIMVLFFNLEQIAAAGSLSVLLVHAAMHLGHLRIIRKTGASVFLVTAALLATLAAIVLGAIYLSQKTPSTLWIIGGFVGMALLLELLLRTFKGRMIQKRFPEW